MQTIFWISEIWSVFILKRQRCHLPARLLETHSPLLPSQSNDFFLCNMYNTSSTLYRSNRLTVPIFHPLTPPPFTLSKQVFPTLPQLIMSQKFATSLAHFFLYFQILFFKYNLCFLCKIFIFNCPNTFFFRFFLVTE